MPVSQSNRQRSEPVIGWHPLPTTTVHACVHACMLSPHPRYACHHVHTLPIRARGGHRAQHQGGAYGDQVPSLCPSSSLLAVLLLLLLGCQLPGSPLSTDLAAARHVTSWDGTKDMSEQQAYWDDVWDNIRSHEHCQHSLSPHPPVWVGHVTRAAALIPVLQPAHGKHRMWAATALETSQEGQLCPHGR
jgi:hypothetical protein